MGGTTSREDGVAFPLREELTRWHMMDVETAYERFKAIKRKSMGKGNALSMSRREFWEVRGWFVV